MRRILATVAIAGATAGAAFAADIAIHNASEHFVINELYVTPASLEEWGPNRLAGDGVKPTGTIILESMAAGSYDLKFIDPTGQTCLVKGVKIGGPPALNFSGEACVASLPD